MVKAIASTANGCPHIHTFTPHMYKVHSTENTASGSLGNLIS